MYVNSKSDRDRRYKARKYVEALDWPQERKEVLHRLIEEGANVTALRARVLAEANPEEPKPEPEKKRDVLDHWTDERARAFTRTEDVRQVLVDAMSERDERAFKNYLHTAKNAPQEHIARFWQRRAERVLTGLA